MLLFRKINCMKHHMSLPIGFYLDKIWLTIFRSLFHSWFPVCLPLGNCLPWRAMLSNATPHLVFYTRAISELDIHQVCVIEGNNFKSYYNGILVLNGNDNTVNKNIFWLTGAVQNQLLDHGDDFGIINVKGNNNMVASNSLSCEWAYAGAVTVNAVQGTGNVFKNCFVDNLESYRVFLVNAQTEVSNCVSSDKVSIVE